MKDYKMSVKYKLPARYGDKIESTAVFWVFAKSEQQARERAKQAVEATVGDVGSTLILDECPAR